MSTTDEEAVEQSAIKTPTIIPVFEKIKNESLLKDLSSNLPLFSVIIIVLGITKQVIYYSNFNLPIKYFLGLSELGLIVADDLLKFSFIFICLFLSNIYTASNFTDIKPHTTSLNNQYLFKAIVLTVFAIISGFIAYKLFHVKFYFVRVIYLTLLITFLAMVLVIMESPKIVGYVSVKKFYSIFFLISITLALIGTTAFEIDDVDEGKYKGTIIKTSDSTYISTDSSFFIGKTEKYIFVFNKKDSTTSIIPTESVKTIIFKETIKNKGSFSWFFKK